jgi:hypothetical protein
VFQFISILLARTKHQLTAATVHAANPHCPAAMRESSALIVPQIVTAILFVTKSFICMYLKISNFIAFGDSKIQECHFGLFSKATSLNKAKMAVCCHFGL